MRKFKFVNFVLCAAFVLSLGVTANASEASNSLIYYYNTFDSGVSSAPNVYNTSAGTMELGDMTDASYNGNNAIAASESTHKSEKFKYTFTTPVTSGILSISFDVSKLDRTELSGDALLDIISDPKGTANERLFFFGTDSINGPSGNSSHPDWTTKISGSTYNANQIYKMNSIIDLDNDKIYTYIDGVLKSTTNLVSANVSQIIFPNSRKIAYFDNLKIRKVSPEAFGVEKITASAADNTVNVVFDEMVNSQSLTSEVVLTDMFGGNKCTLSSATLKDSQTVEFKAESGFIKDGGEYKLTFSDNFKSAFDAAVSPKEYYFSAGDGKYLKSVRFKDVFGNVLALDGEIVPEISEVILEFTDKCELNDLTDVAIGSEAAAKVTDGKKMTLKLDNCLMGNTDYTLSMSAGLDREYAISFKTAAGKLSVKDVKYYKNDTTTEPVTDLNGLAVNDKLYVEVTYIKTVATEKTFLASASLWNGLDMNDYDYEVVKLGENETKKTVTLDFEIKNKDDLKVKTFMWKGNGKINPIWDVFEVK